MVDEVELSRRRIVEAGAERAERSFHKHTMGGALLGGIWFAAAFPLAISGLMGTLVGSADAAVYMASGALFGLVSGGTIGAVIAGRGR